MASLEPVTQGHVEEGSLDYRLSLSDKWSLPPTQFHLSAAKRSSSSLETFQSDVGHPSRWYGQFLFYNARLRKSQPKWARYTKHARMCSHTSQLFIPWPGSGSESVIMNTRGQLSRLLFFSNALEQNYHNRVTLTWSSWIGCRGPVTCWNGM